jgi:hypothetical protein
MTSQVRRLKAFGDRIQAAATRDADRDLDLAVDCERLRHANIAADYFIKLLRESNPVSPSGELSLVTVFEGARDAVGTVYERWEKKPGGVREADALLLADVAALHDKLNTLCWIFREQEADQDATLPGEFTNAADLFAAMGV